MITRILCAIGDADTARHTTTLTGQLPGAEPGPVLADSTALLDTLGRLAAESVEELPEVVLVHERIGPVPALELVREVALRFPAVGVVLLSAETGPALYSAAMDAGARGLVGLPLSYDELATRVQAAAAWASGVRRHLGAGGQAPSGPAGTLVTVTGAKGGVGTTVTAVQLALAARASGRSVALVDMDLQAGDVASYLDVQFRRSVADLAEITDISPRVLQDAMFSHATGVFLLLAPAEGERGEEVGDRAARQVIGALRSRFEVVVVDCGSQMNGANAVAVETADTALLVTTPDVVAVRAAKRMVRLWDRLQIRKAEDTVVVVNRHSRNSEIQPALVERLTGTRAARAAVPAAFKELQPVVDSGRMQDLDNRSSVKQALWALAAEIGLVEAAPDRQGKSGGALVPAPRGRGRGRGGDRGSFAVARRGGTHRGARGRGGPAGAPGSDDRGQVAIETLGLTPMILAVLVVLWQFVLTGYTFTLAGNAADEAVRAAAAAEGDPGAAADAAARAHLPGAWNASVSTGSGGGMVTADVRLRVPVLFPGGVDFPFSVTGSAGAAQEDLG
ncbi:AAA family ATPase [Streptomyces sp. SCUT-3]|uniref:AAA family ATPase n=2 Tax=Streptomyces TaxID=1883 RepID=UPI0015F802F8|nr:AAA family ATPase [Streptomyces sp. SCUT-3]QMV21968.1 AAA family ATPase [Streptomyces sp. SCUT-3]